MENSQQNNEYVFKVNLGGMIDILSNHLYSSPDVFVRELLQNGVDAISAKNSQGYSDGKDLIDIILSKNGDNLQLNFRDYGVGLTEEEIHKFLAVIGQSSKKGEFVPNNGDYIGRFGIGLLSCFLVSDEIKLQTRSVKNPKICLEWNGKPDGTYIINECNALEGCGSQVILQLKKGCEEYFTADKISKLVTYYGLPLPYPIYLYEGNEQQMTGIRLNPPFPVGKSAKKQIMALGKNMFGCDFIDFIPLESKTGLYSGVAYIMAEETAPTVKQNHRIYLKNMLLTEDRSKLLPKWAFFLKCFINTNKLMPTASREDFYEDEKLLAAREELSNNIITYLQKLSITKNPTFEKLVKIHRLAVSSVAVNDDLLYKSFFPHLTFETSFGILTGEQLSNYRDEIVYTNYVDEFRQFSQIFMAKGRLLVNGGYTYVSKLIERIVLLNPDCVVSVLKISSIDKMLSNPENITNYEIEKFTKYCNEVLDSKDCICDLKRFEPADLPALYIVNDDGILLRDIENSVENSDQIFSGLLNSFADEFADKATAKLYFNSDNFLIRKLMLSKDDKKRKCCIEILYIQSLLTGGYSMHMGELQTLNENLSNLLDWSL